MATLLLDAAVTSMLSIGVDHAMVFRVALSVSAKALGTKRRNARVRPQAAIRGPGGAWGYLVKERFSRRPYTLRSGAALIYAFSPGAAMESTLECVYAAGNSVDALRICLLAASAAGAQPTRTACVTAGIVLSCAPERVRYIMPLREVLNGIMLNTLALRCALTDSRWRAALLLRRGRPGWNASLPGRDAAPSAIAALLSAPGPGAELEALPYLGDCLVRNVTEAAQKLPWSVKEYLLDMAYAAILRELALSLPKPLYERARGATQLRLWKALTQAGRSVPYRCFNGLTMAELREAAEGRLRPSSLVRYVTGLDHGRLRAGLIA